MSPAPSCPRCPTPVARGGPAPGWSCPEHGSVAPLWRTDAASYDSFVEHLGRTRTFPTYLPWPISPGWHVTDVAAVGDEDSCRASLTCSSGTSELDGPVDVLVVAEEPGTGLGARVAGIRHPDPGPEVGQGSPTARVRIGSQAVPLWPVSISIGAGEWDRSVVAGEAAGRWLWLVLRPASAVLLLHDDWILRDVSDLGPALLGVPFGGPGPAW